MDADIHPAPGQSDAAATDILIESPWFKSVLGYSFVVFLFVASGLSSLVYQVVWTRSLVLVFGSTTFATSTVLAVFMGGLALGSFISGKFSDRIKRPYFCYGVLEGLIGLWALAVPFLLDGAIPIYKAAWQFLHLSVLPFSLLRFILCSAILIVPTTLMGATLPLLARFVTHSLDIVGNRVGTLYAANTLGAIGGAMLSGFLFIPAWGLQTATIIAAIINFALLGLVILTAPFLESVSTILPAGKHKRTPLPGSVRMAVLAFALSGAASMIYEVGWTRALLLVIGSSTYAFTVMLSSFLIGIFLGSLAFSQVVDRIKNHLSWFALMQFLICLTGLASLSSYNLLPWWNLALNARFPIDSTTTIFIRFGLAAATLIPLTYCIGATFPIIVKAATRDIETVGSSVGSLYSANTLGAIIGAFLAGFVLIPVAGVETTIILACITNLCIGLLILLPLDSIRLPLKLLVCAVSLAAIVWGINKPRLWDRIVLLSNQQQRRSISVSGLQFPSYAQWRAFLNSNRQLQFWKDGASSTVGVFSSNASGHKSLVTNGHIDGSNGGDMSTQLLVAAYPLLFKPEAPDVAVVGWGTGVSVGACTIFPTRSITAIELEPAVVEASNFFHDVNQKPENDKRVHIEYNDGRNYLLATDRKFDVIVSEPSNPWQAGVCNLFTKEYFTICKDHLKPDGIFSCWMQTIELSPSNIKRVLSSLQAVFPNNLAIKMDRGNIAILSSNNPIKIDYSSLSRIMSDPKVSKQLTNVGINSPESLLAQILLTPATFKQITAGVSPNIDDTNKLEYSVGNTYEDHFYGDDNYKMFAEFTRSPWTAVDLKVLSKSDRAKIMTKVAKIASTNRNFKTAMEWSSESINLSPSAEALRIEGVAYFKLGQPEKANRSWEQALEIAQNPIDTLQTRALAFMYAGKLDRARSDLSRILELNPENKVARYRMATTYAGRHVFPPEEEPLQLYSIGPPKDYHPETVLNLLGDLPENKIFIQSHPKVLFLAAEANLSVNQLKTAERQARQYISVYPASIAGQRLLGSILYALGNTREGTSWWTASLTGGARYAETLSNQAKNQLAEGDKVGALHSLTRAMELNPASTNAKTGLQSMSSIHPQSKPILDSFQLKRYQTEGKKN